MEKKPLGLLFIRCASAAVMNQGCGIVSGILCFIILSFFFIFFGGGACCWGCPGSFLGKPVVKCRFRAGWTRQNSCKKRIFTFISVFGVCVCVFMYVYVYVCVCVCLSLCM